MFYVVTLFVCWIYAASAAPKVGIDVKSENIIHGVAVPIEAVPYQVGILVKEMGELFYFCGGSIISSDSILTAGHCAGVDAERYTIRAGTSKWSHGGSTHKVVKVMRHENYGFNKHGVVINDIAIMRVDPPFELDDTRRVIELFSIEHGLKAGVLANVTGWGKMEDQTMAVNLQLITIPVLDREECNAAHEKKGGVPEGEFCAADPRGIKDMCNGDSGGALVVQGVQAGIVSWSGPSCAVLAFPGVYTEVAHFLSWIHDHLQS